MGRRELTAITADGSECVVYPAVWNDLGQNEIPIVISSSKHKLNCELKLLSTLGLIEAGISEIQSISSARLHDIDSSKLQRKKKKIEKKGTPVLYDAMDIFSTAKICGAEVEWKFKYYFQGGLPELDMSMNLSGSNKSIISEERRELLSSVTGYSLLMAMSSPKNSPASRFFPLARLDECLFSITDGMLDVQFSDETRTMYDKTHSLSPDEEKVLLKGIEPGLVVPLIHSGVVEISSIRERKMYENLAIIHDILRLWRYAMESVGLGVYGEENADLNILRKLARAIGMHEMVAAYLEGVPFEDIVA